MKNTLKLFGVLGCCMALFAASSYELKSTPYYTTDDLRAIYSSGNTDSWPKPHIDSTVINFREIGILGEMSFPDDNPFSEEKKELGKTLFFDPRLSGSQQISCASCHDPELGWADGRRVSYGHDRQQGVRNAKTILNVGYAEVIMWDGRAATLEEQVLLPMNDTRELNIHPEIAAKNIAKIKGYRPLFKNAFGDEEVTIERIAKAIATFERTVVSRKSKFDRFVSGDSKVYTDQEVQGLHLFRTKARCINCHNGPNFSDGQLHNAGLTYFQRKYQDLGLYEITKNLADIGKFKTPTLRELKLTAPYMHNGLFPHLRGVINMYNAGMPNLKPRLGQEGDPMFPKTSELLKELHLTEEEISALEAFLLTLSTNNFRETIPTMPK